jgi:conjugative relaxase-like TrwC/TraI family protein
VRWFAVPKSVSTVYALGDPLAQQEVITSCEAALADALSWLEREACFVRRGTNNRDLVRDPTEFGTRRMVGEGFVAAQFPHRTSRLGDPHLHWHVLVANTARGIDGRWSALDGTALYRSQRTVGVLFQAAMRSELSRRLGVEWGPIHNDSAEIAGIPARLLREFSQRHEQIAEWLDITGRSGPQAAGQALLETRTSKHELDDFATLEAGWRTRADQVGWGPAQLDQLLSNTPNPPAVGDDERWVIRDTTWRSGEPTAALRDVSFEEWVDWLLTTRVTEKTGTFTRFDLTQAVAANMPTGTSLASVDASVNRALASDSIAQVGDHWNERRHVDAPGRMVCDDRELRYTSRSLLAVEQRLLTQLGAGAQVGVGTLDPTVVNVAIEASTLGEDQASAIRVLTSAGDRVAVMVGRAGTGKTHTLGTLQDVYEQAGWTVIGLAPSARAARELHDGSGIKSTTIARHGVEQRTITATTLVVIDEAAMAGTRDVAALVDQVTAAGAKAVLVGDHHQLPEVAAGGAFRAALDTLGERVVELTINRRQQHRWQQEALDELRCGDVPTAFAAYRDHGRVVIADSPDDLHAIVLADWHAARGNGDALLLAGTRAEARLLNRYARRMLAAKGELDLESEISFGERGYVVGDQVVMCRNHSHQHLSTGADFAVDNGMRGTVTDISSEQMTVEITSDEHVVLDRAYLEHSWVDHAYAVTIHKAQGVTCDSVFVVGPAGLYREGAYVALSRARHEAWLYATSLQAADLAEAHRHGIPLPTEAHPDPEADLLERLHISAAENLVVVDDPHAPAVADLVNTIPAPELLRRARHATDAEHNCGMDNPAAASAELEAAVLARSHLTVGRRVRAVDRDNVGHVMAIDDTAGRCIVHFESVEGRTAVRHLDWAELIVIDHPEPAPLTEEASATLAGRERDVQLAEQSWRLALASYGVSPGEADLYRRALHTAADHAARSLQADPPEWLTIVLGPRPETPAAASVWDDATTRIGHHRLIHDIDNNEPGIGPRPTDATPSGHWQDLMIRLLEDRLWLTDHPEPDVEPLRVASPTELIERQDELQHLLASAPADQRQFIDRIVTSQLDPTELHEYLTAAMAVQDARRDWIITNWPHLIELEQVTQLIAKQQPLAHWPTAQPDPVRDVLEQLRQLAPRLDAREERTLAELDRQEADSDPVLKLEGRRAHLRRLAGRTASPGEHDVIKTELASLNDQLRTARREQSLQQAFDRYLPTATDEARATRITTLAHDTLTAAPAWVVEHIRYLHDNDQLTTCDIPTLATRITKAAAYHDLHGQLPAPWIEPTVDIRLVPQPSLDLEP